MILTTSTREKELGQTIFTPLGLRTLSEIYLVLTTKISKGLEVGLFENRKVCSVWAEGVREGSRELQSI